LDGISSLAARPQYGQVIIEIKVISADHDTKAAGSGVLSRHEEMNEQRGYHHNENDRCLMHGLIQKCVAWSGGEVSLW
jgi:hypothetical protein